LDDGADEFANALAGGAAGEAFQGLLAGHTEAELLEDDGELGDEGVVRVAGFVDDLADGAGEILAGTHGEGH
jgi:hypothetical protein